MTTCSGTMSETTKLYKTVKVQTLEADLQLVTRTRVHLRPLTLESTQNRSAADGSRSPTVLRLCVNLMLLM